MSICCFSASFWYVLLVNRRVVKLESTLHGEKSEGDWSFSIFVFDAAVLMGPVRATTYVLVYGLLSVALGISFRLQLPWLFGIPLCSIARLSGQGLYILLSSWITSENLLYLLISNAQTLLVSNIWIIMYLIEGFVERKTSDPIVSQIQCVCMQDNMSSWIGTSGSASFLGVAIALVSMLVVNSLFYVFMMHVLYTMILKNMGYKVNPLPQFLQRLAA